jgi:hypothetical protein
LQFESEIAITPDPRFLNDLLLIVTPWHAEPERLIAPDDGREPNGTDDGEIVGAGVGLGVGFGVGVGVGLGVGVGVAVGCGVGVGVGSGVGTGVADAAEVAVGEGPDVGSSVADGDGSSDVPGVAVGGVAVEEADGAADAPSDVADGAGVADEARPGTIEALAPGVEPGDAVGDGTRPGLERTEPTVSFKVARTAACPADPRVFAVDSARRESVPVAPAGTTTDAPKAPFEVVRTFGIPFVVESQASWTHARAGNQRPLTESDEPGTTVPAAVIVGLAASVLIAVNRSAAMTASAVTTTARLRAGRKATAAFGRGD